MTLSDRMEKVLAVGFLLKGSLQTVRKGLQEAINVSILTCRWPVLLLDFPQLKENISSRWILSPNKHKV